MFTNAQILALIASCSLFTKMWFSYDPHRVVIYILFYKFELKYWE